MARKLRVLFVSAECSPFARTGGLGDVSAALPEALSDKDITIRRVMPLYRDVNCDLRYKTDFTVPMNEGFQGCLVKYEPNDKKAPTYFTGNDWYFNRDKLYGYYDDGERFTYFCKAVVEMLKHIPFKPDIIHCNDWHAGLIPLLVKAEGLNIKTVFTIHNLKYSGSIPASYLQEYNIKEDILEKLGYPDNIDFMKTGILFSDHITTVSQGYAEEIQTPEFGEGLQELLLQNKDKLSGILNGIDIKSFSPEKAQIPYDMENIQAKSENKVLLKQELGLESEDVPLISAVTRLDDQKGIDILINAIRKIDIEGFQFVLLGTGNKYYEELLQEMASMYPGKMAAKFVFDTELSKKIYAGSDIFIMPSRFEPGGLGQLYAMEYGTVPVVRYTGGLKDTVIDPEMDKDNANGFCFESYSVSAFVGALKRAIDTYNTPEWLVLMKNGMSMDKSWKKPAAEYIEIYKSLADNN